MIEAAHGVAALAAELQVSPRRLQRVFVGDGGLTGPRAALAREFAAAHAITLRAYVHPALRAHYLVSAPSGWLSVPAEPGGWKARAPYRRDPGSDWSSLPLLEVDFAFAWSRISTN